MARRWNYKKLAWVILALAAIGGTLSFFGFGHYPSDLNLSRSLHEEIGLVGREERKGLERADEEARSTLRVSRPQPEETLVSPVEIVGEAQGGWYFEATFPVRMMDESGVEVGRGYAEAEGDWMTDEFVPFRSTLYFDPGEATRGKLVLEKANPSGLPENAAAIEIPVHFNKEGKSVTVKVFFGRSGEQSTDCGVVYGVDRQIASTLAVGRAALQELLKGPSPEETKEGYTTTLDPDTVISSLEIRGGTAYVEFGSELEQNVSGACRVTAMRAQITETLKQFSSVQDVVISVEGRTEDILQP
jgi:hypothetical protein